MTLNADERQAIVTYRLEKAESTYNDVLKSMEFGMFSTAAKGRASLHRAKGHKKYRRWKSILQIWNKKLIFATCR